MSIRSGAQHVDVYNEGFLVFLYDPAHADEIVKANPKSILEYSRVEPEKDKKLKQLTDAGTIAVFELDQDDPVSVDVVIGAPLTKAELKKSGVAWLKPVRGLLKIVSGRLRIDTANTFRLFADARRHADFYTKKHGKPPADDDFKSFGLTDPSGEAIVPPGDYVLTLHRIDFDTFDEDMEWDGPGEVITLTPAAEIAPLKKVPPILRYAERRVWYTGLRAARLKDGKFEGLVLSTNVVNMTWKHARALGLRRGQRLRIENGGVTHNAMFVGGACPLQRGTAFELLYPDKLETFVEQDPEFLVAAIAADKITKLSLLRLNHPSLSKSVQGEDKSAVVIEPQDEFYVDPPAALPDDLEGRIEDGVLRGTVIFKGPRSLILGAGKKQLKALGVKVATEFMLTIGDRSERMIFLAETEEDFRPYHITKSGQDKDDELNRRIVQYMGDGGDAVFKSIIGVPRAAEITRLVKLYLSQCTFHPEKGYVPNDKAVTDQTQRQYRDLWREGLARWQGRESMVAQTQPHWDVPELTVLECKPIHYPAEFSFHAAPGDAYTLAPVE